MPHRMDLEKPYQDAAAREERFQERKAEKYESLWDELRDEVFAEKFIDDHFEDPRELFANIVSEIADCRVTLEKCRGEHGIAGVRDDALTTLFTRLELRLEKYVDIVAESRAENDSGGI